MNMTGRGLEMNLVPAGNDEVGVELDIEDTVVLGSTTAFAAWVRHVQVSCKTNAVLYTLDGTDPANATVTGAILAANQTVYWPIRRWKAARFVEAVAASHGRLRVEPMSSLV